MVVRWGGTMVVRWGGAMVVRWGGTIVVRWVGWGQGTLPTFYIPESGLIPKGGDSAMRWT